jgi:2-polyprenyl-6-methoxyphenol hydroxylase-like FAD-dependent oxidoreductase
MRVAIAGGGLGGLCLAQGLCRAGVDVTVYERDAGLNVRHQGYRVHLDARAGKALAACLSPEQYALFTATCGVPSSRLSVVSERLRPLHTEAMTYPPELDRFAPESLSTAANRQTLREILASGLEGRIRFGCRVAGYELTPGGVQGDRGRVDGGRVHGVRVDGADGSAEWADVLVAADGVSSVVAQQYLPNRRVIDTGTRCVYGRTPLPAERPPWRPEPVRDGFTAVVGNQVGMAIAAMRFRNPVSSAARVSGLDVDLSPAGDYIMWALTAQADRWPEGGARLETMDAAELHAVATTMIKRWHPDLQALVAAADVDETFMVRIRTSQPIEPWAPSPVTVLGDAIHAMSPARGSGANTALRDAALLSQQLVAAAQGQKSLLSGIGEYEQQMVRYGFEAVRASAEAEARTVAHRRSLGFWIFDHLPRFGR